LVRCCGDSRYSVPHGVIIGDGSIGLGVSVAYAEDVGSEDEEGKADKLGCDMVGSGIDTFQIAATFGWIKLSASPWTIRMITSRQIKQEPQQTAQSLSKPDETHSLPLHGSADESTLR